MFKQIVVIVLFTMTSCGKEFLNVKRNENQVVPTTIDDYQALLDRVNIMNGSPPIIMAFIGSDEYSVTTEIWKSLAQPYERNGYIWNDEIYEGRDFSDWNNAYQRILYTNMALDVEKIKPSIHEYEAWNNVKGSAHFFRAYNYYHLAQIFCKAYDLASASTDLGLPLRIDYDVTVNYKRSSLQELYEFIISDLEISLELLPKIGINKYRPSKLLTYMMLAKIYLQMENYELAHEHSVLALNIKDDLVDFNKIEMDLDYSFISDNGASHPEILFFNYHGSTIVNEQRINLSAELIELYEPNDLRKNIYFKETKDERIVFKGSYSSNLSYFTGLATNELWLLRAETAVRSGNLKDAEDSLNNLLKHRYLKNNFEPYIFQNEREALSVILTERRKELIMRGTRWEDLRRLNKDPEYANTIVRLIDGKRHELLPNDPRWVWPLPDSELQFLMP